MQRLFLAFVAVLFLAGFCLAQDWNVQVVDNEGNAGEGTGIWTDSLGYPHIIYRSGTALKYAKWTGSGWERTQIHGMANSNQGCLDLTLDSLGTPHCAIIGSDSHTYYGFLSDTGWVFEDLGLFSDRYYISIALDIRQNPHLAFGSSSLQHTYWDTLSSQWVNETALPSESCTWKSIAVDSQDNIYIAYCTSSYPLDLKFAYYDSTETWGTPYIDYEGSVGQYCNMILDDNDIPHIAYYDATNSRLKYATWSPPASAIR